MRPPEAVRRRPLPYAVKPRLVVALRTKRLYSSRRLNVVPAGTVIGVAGEIGAKRARGPGSFVPEILDAVYALDRDTLIERAKVN